VTSVNSDSS